MAIIASTLARIKQDPLARLVVIATTLLDPVLYPKQRVATLYGLRWEIETDFRHLKTTMKMEHLKCQTVDGVLKELMIFALVYNLVRATMSMAGQRQGVDPNRISFVDTLRWLRSQCTPPPKKQLAAVDLVVNPLRPGRWSPRVIKRRIKPYDLMNRPRHEYKQAPVEQEVEA